MLRKCKDCGIEAKAVEDLEKFSKGANKIGRINLCYECKNKRQNKRRGFSGRSRRKKGTFSGKKEQSIFYKYGLLPEEHKLLKEKQRNLCKICGEHKDGIRNNGHSELSVDHCHSSGKVRGLLCMRCNTALGMANDDIQILNKMIGYLSS